VAETITVRKARREDLEDLLRIQQQSLPQAAEWSAGALLEGLAGCLVAQIGDRLAGFLLFREIAPAEREILNLAVDPALRRRGVASRLIAEFLHSDEGDVFLEVRESNEDAKAFYVRRGFAEVGLRPGYYHRPVEDAVVMKRPAKNVLYANEG
jgi:ribosomal-protein-alanine N-acetyltransferase